MACNYHRAWRHGTALEVRMPTLNPDLRFLGYVAWCLRRKRGYLVGIAFVDEQTLFSARMGEQVCQIERYCRQHDAHNDLQEIQALALRMGPAACRRVLPRQGPRRAFRTRPDYWTLNRCHAHCRATV